jgi:plasmid stabilization system protein ParE
MKVEYSAAAENDLENIGDWISLRTVSIAP